MQGHQLVRCVPLFLGSSTVCCADFFVQDLYVHFVAALFDLPEDAVLCRKMVVVMFGSEGVRKNYISVAVISLHKIEVTTARAYGKAPYVNRVEFSGRLLPNV